MESSSVAVVGAVVQRLSFRRVNHSEQVDRHTARQMDEVPPLVVIDGES
jgi:hypothetical protein